MRKSSAN